MRAAARRALRAAAVPAVLAFAVLALAACAARAPVPGPAGGSPVAQPGEPPHPGITPLTVEQDEALRR